MWTTHITTTAVMRHQPPRPGILSLLLAAITMAAAIAVAPLPADAEIDPRRTPGGGEPVRLARPTWDTGWFQAEIISQLLTELGYRVDGPTTMETNAFYGDVAADEVDLWVNGWFPLHDPLLAEPGDSTTADGGGGAIRVGFEVRGGALQGYMADAATVAALGIETLADLADPEVAAAFDSTGDGRADLIGCNPDWACGPIVDHHLEVYGLSDTVDQVRGDYGPLMQATVDRYRAGEGVLFYTFTPNWTVGELVPGTDVVWIPAPFPSLPPEIADQEPLTIVDQVAGCLDDPCSMGFAPSDIRAVASRSFLAANPSVQALLEGFEIALDDISAQNASMTRDEDAAADIAAYASRWIEEHRIDVDRWLAAAVEAHEAAGLALAPGPGDAAAGGDRLGTLRVVTRLAPPFVDYQGSSYGGFSIELLRLVASDIGADVEIYAVNSSAKLIDDVDRGAAAIGVGAVAITSEREHEVDFTQPYIDSGLQILVADRDPGLFGGRLGSVTRNLFSGNLLALVLVLIVAMTLSAHAIWLTERRKNPDFPVSYRAGIWESLWWAAVTATTVGYGDKTPKGTAGRIFGLFWMFSGLFLLAYFTAGITTAFTIEELHRSIDEPADLRGRSVGVVADSAAPDFLARQGIGAVSYPTDREAYEALLDGELEAFVHNAAILQHFVATDGRGGVDVSGLVFAERGFGFIVETDSELTEILNRSLLSLIESGRFDALHEQWFGADSAAGGRLGPP